MYNPEHNYSLYIEIEINKIGLKEISLHKKKLLNIEAFFKL